MMHEVVKVVVGVPVQQETPPRCLYFWTLSHNLAVCDIGREGRDAIHFIHGLLTPEAT